MNDLRPSRRRRLEAGLETLESRRLLAFATYVVTSAADDGPGSLRQALLAVDNDPGPDEVDFAVGSGLQTIVLQSPLPSVTVQVTLNATTQPGFAGRPLIELDGADLPAGSGSAALVLSGGGSAISGFIINRFPGDGIDISGNGGDSITGNFIGTDATGSSALGNGGTGILISGATSETIGSTSSGAGDVIAGNGGAGIDLENVTSSSIQGDLIGTDVTGRIALGNGGDGIRLMSQCDSVTIGGTGAGAHGLISGNGGDGVDVDGSHAIWIQDVDVGTDLTGTAALGNGGDGIVVEDGSNRTALQQDVISGNAGNGVAVRGQATAYTDLGGDRIGTDASGTKSLGNELSGLLVEDGSGLGTPPPPHLGQGGGGSGSGSHSGSGGLTGIYGTAPADTAPNLLSGNGRYGLEVSRKGGIAVASGALYIGTDANGTAALGNARGGVLFDGATASTLSGAIVSGNGGPGITIDDGSQAITLTGDKVGADVSGTKPLGNAGDGISIDDANQVAIGPPTPAPPTPSTPLSGGNVILANAGWGLTVQGASTAVTDVSNTVGGNTAGDVRILGLADAPVAPAILSASSDATRITIRGMFRGAPTTTYALQVFVPANATGAWSPLGATVITTDAQGMREFAVSLPRPPALGTPLVVMGTPPKGSTSAPSTPVVVEAEANLAVNLSGPSMQVIIGNPVTFAVLTRNAGPLAASSVLTTLQIPEGLSVASVSLDVADWRQDGKMLSLALGDLAVGATSIVNVSLIAGAPGAYPLTAVVSGASDYDPDPTDDTANSSATVVDRPGTLQFDAVAAPVVENQGFATLRVDRVGGQGGAVSVLVTTRDGSARAGVDYAPFSTELIFADGQASRLVEVPLIDQERSDPARTLAVVLSEPGGGSALGSATVAIVTIHGDYPALLPESPPPANPPAVSVSAPATPAAPAAPATSGSATEGHAARQGHRHRSRPSGPTAHAPLVPQPRGGAARRPHHVAPRRRR